jgi:L-asparagine transporter-like permease
MIFLTHLFFRRRVAQDGVQLRFRMPAYPIGTLLGLIGIVAILVTTWFIDIFHYTLLFGVPFLLILIGAYLVRTRI